jgi:hypothetical protein
MGNALRPYMPVAMPAMPSVPNVQWPSVNRLRKVQHSVEYRTHEAGRPIPGLQHREYLHRSTQVLLDPEQLTTAEDLTKYLVECFALQELEGHEYIMYWSEGPLIGSREPCELHAHAYVQDLIQHADIHFLLVQVPRVENEDV